MIIRRERERELNNLGVGVFLVLIALVCLGVLLATDVVAEEPADKATLSYSPKQIERLILWSVENESCDPKLLPVIHNTDYRKAVARGFVDASLEFNIPVLYLVAVGYRESRYKLDVVGDKGKSLGMM